jgi:hypothetical protein
VDVGGKLKGLFLGREMKLNAWFAKCAQSAFSAARTSSRYFRVRFDERKKQLEIAPYT